jgi:hypothetical protein
MPSRLSGHCGSSWIGSTWNQKSNSQASINIDITATPIANTSPKVIRVRPGSSRLATRPRIFNVAKPNTAPEDVVYTSGGYFGLNEESTDAPVPELNWIVAMAKC